MRRTPWPARQPLSSKKHCCVRAPGWSRDRRCDAQAGPPAHAARQPFRLRSGLEHFRHCFSEPVTQVYAGLWAARAGGCCSAQAPCQPRTTVSGPNAAADCAAPLRPHTTTWYALPYPRPGPPHGIARRECRAPLAQRPPQRADLTKALTQGTKALQAVPNNPLPCMAPCSTASAAAPRPHAEK